MTSVLLVTALVMCVGIATAQEPHANRWKLDKQGGITTDRATLTRGADHSDHIEMAGRSVNAIVKWHVTNDGHMHLNRIVRWPMVREIKDDTHASLDHDFTTEKDQPALFNGHEMQGVATEFRINGFLQWTEVAASYRIVKQVFPSTSLPCLLERWVITNTSDKPADIELPTSQSSEVIPKEKLLSSAARVTARWIPGGRFRLMPNQSATFGRAFSAVQVDQPDLYPDINSEYEGRQAFIASTIKSLDLKTDDPAVDQLFAFSKLRAAENVLATRGGLMHAPGGFNKYLAALWCNDQNEYASPFFPFLGDPAGNESARNAYLWFSKYINSDYRALPSSIVAEGRGTWQGAGDRGDAAMTAYGAGRWALSTGDPARAREVWPLIQWCLEYCNRHKTSAGVIASDRDELEGRFSTGAANLATSCLAYDALVTASYIVDELNEPKSLGDKYRSQADDLRAAIQHYFGAEVGGYETYRYHEGLTTLRSWICIPLVMDIEERAAGTINALFSPKLWTKDGLLTAEGSKTYWDRSTLYALRGVFRAGNPEKAADYLHQYSERRLLGDHVPYCIEAYPESNQSHLSAESALYCRILIEGAVGIRPIGFNKFTIRPQLPPQWKAMRLNQIHAFGRVWDCLVTRKQGGVEVAIRCGDQICYKSTRPAGSEHMVTLP